MRRLDVTPRLDRSRHVRVHDLRRRRPRQRRPGVRQQGLQGTPRSPRRADATRVARRRARAVANVDGAALTPKDRRRRARTARRARTRAMAAATRARDGIKYARRIRGASGDRRVARRRDDGNPTTDPAPRCRARSRRPFARPRRSARPSSSRRRRRMRSSKR